MSEENLEKATNIPTKKNLEIADSRIPKKMSAFPSLSTFQGHIYEEARKELRFPNSIKLYKQMLLDPNIASATSLIEMMIGKVEWKFKVKDSSSEVEKQRAKMLNYNLLSMERPFQDYIIEILSYLYYGFHLSEKVYANYQTPYGDFIGINDLVTMSQDTVEKWIFLEETGKLIGVRQNLNNILSDARRVSQMGHEKDIPKKKFILFRHSPKRNNPEGTSTLKSCYVSWKLRNLVEEYESVGVSKDLGGTVVVGVDASYLSKAQSDPTSDEAKVVSELERQAASVHAGDQSYVLLPIAYDDKGKELFSFKLQGIDGGGKQYSTDDVVKRHDSKILMAFFADVLKLGNDQHGSFALASSKTSILAMAIESHLNNIAKEFNHDLVRQLYKMNGWEYNPEESVRMVFSDIEKQDLDELGKFVQRVGSVGGMRFTEGVETYLREQGFGMNSFSDDNDQEIVPKIKNESRAGESQGSSGTGNSQSGGVSSSTNSDNAS